MSLRARLDLPAIGRFCRRQWWHLLVIPFGIVGVTTLHEAAHAAAAWAQGGRVTDFVVIPGDGRWGSMAYEFPPGAVYSADAISLAPYLMWATSMLLMALAARRRRRWRFAAASTMFLWGYTAAFGDVVNAWLGWMLGGANDLAHAFGAPPAIAAVALAATVPAVVAAGYHVHRGLYREAALAPVPYVALAAAGAATVASALLLTGGP